MLTRHQPALLGGALIGVLSGLPFVGAGNCCCCLWVVLGGVLVTYLEQERAQGPVEVAALVRAGLLAGVLGAVISFVLNTAFDLMLKQVIRPEQQQQLIEQMTAFLPPELRDMFTNAQTAQSGRMIVVARFFQFCAMVLIYGLFGMLGALLGSAIFKKKLPPVAEA